MKINNDWDLILKEEFEKEYFKKIESFLDKAYEEKNIYPPRDEIFKSLELSSFEDTNVVILGQDPYYNPGQAEGLSFSVKKGVKLPPSLRNIYKEMNNDLGLEPAKNGTLISWARQGVLLLNASLTVEEKKPNSHKSIGWQIFTDKIISLLNERERPLVFILWGNFARSKKALITNSRHLILESAHPSPLSARNGFLGSKPFSKTNEFLKKNNLKVIDWEIED
ncbi:uracil-DNA glycosylase [Anaerococcus lactolyticus]|uniref:Uracil-DNA glycosylase n=2 Tax=Anaerococcus lactolyticus TaxID=33032 RepID=C2BDE2_9FIRM|nr:uracil-DNA glycosylase [Anaerococcus lactolyticus]EEI87129.1 uracil-DNA glycosylase [Anaerococcus lactolyticus ATCC 51172]KGF03138.1 uracil-DNA glycosylase [Anaerococcus lactolyticus S7-1-13]